MKFFDIVAVKASAEEFQKIIRSAGVMCYRVRDAKFDSIPRKQLKGWWFRRRVARIRIVVVNVNWNSDDHKWNCNANDLDADDRWNDGNYVFSRSLPYYLPNLILGKFL